MFRLAWALAGALLLGGCASGVSETHYFSTIDKSSGAVVNVFRLKVSGTSGMTNARYLAGVYDERAIDLFFNEVKSTPLDTASAGAGADKFFKFDCAAAVDANACKAVVDKNLATVPVGSSPQAGGAFMLLYSTNPDAIANTIGSFADNQDAVQSMMYLATRDTRQAAAKIAAEQPYSDKSRAGVMSELDTLITSAAAATTDDAREDLYLAALRTIAVGIEPNAPPRFADFDQARAWFAAHPRSIAP